MSPTFSCQDRTKYKCKVIEKQGYTSLCRTDHIFSLSLSLSPSFALIKTLQLQVWMLSFFYHIVHKDKFYNIYYLLSFSVLLPFSPHFIGHFLSNLSLSLIFSLSLFLKHTFTTYYRNVLVSIDYNNNCIYTNHSPRYTIRLVHLKYIDREFIIEFAQSSRHPIAKGGQRSPSFVSRKGFETH